MSAELLDDLLQLFVVLFLKSEESVQVSVMSDLDAIFNLLKSRETSIFIDKNFSYKVIFFNVSQFNHCSSKMEEGKQANSDKKIKCSNLKRTFQDEAKKLREREARERTGNQTARDSNDYRVDGC